MQINCLLPCDLLCMCTMVFFIGQKHSWWFIGFLSISHDNLRMDIHLFSLAVEVHIWLTGNSLLASSSNPWWPIQNISLWSSPLTQLLLIFKHLLLKLNSKNHNLLVLWIPSVHNVYVFILCSILLDIVYCVPMTAQYFKTGPDLF